MAKLLNVVTSYVVIYVDGFKATNTSVYAKQHDSGLRHVVVCPRNKLGAMQCTGEVSVECSIGNDIFLYNVGNVSQTKFIDIPIHDNLLKASGIVKCVVKIKEQDGGTIIISPFFIEVDDSLRKIQN